MSVSKIDPSNEGGSNFLYAGRLVEMKREGNTVYARSLRRGEEDTGEGVHIAAGERLVIPKGEMVIDSRDVDEYHNPVGLGGYRPIANTVWAWHQFATEQLGFLLFFFALARRTDAAHSLWATAIQARDNAREEQGSISARQAHFAALGAAEMAIIALGRCYRMVDGLVEKFCPELSVPDSVAETRAAVKAMRDAFEHIDERAEGKVKIGELHPEALTIFDQPDFVTSSVLRYRRHELNFETEVIQALVDCRELIMDAIDSRRVTQQGELADTDGTASGRQVGDAEPETERTRHSGAGGRRG